MLKRRIFLRHLAFWALASAIQAAATPQAYAEDGHDGGHDGHENDGHDDDGHDDDGGDDGGDDDGGDKDKNNPNGLDQNEALRELKNGRIIPLKTALKIVDSRVSGKVIDVKLTRTLGRSQYRIKIRRDDGVITTIRLDAKTGNFVGVLGF